MSVLLVLIVNISILVQGFMIAIFHFLMLFCFLLLSVDCSSGGIMCTSPFVFLVGIYFIDGYFFSSFAAILRWLWGGSWKVAQYWLNYDRFDVAWQEILLLFRVTFILSISSLVIAAADFRGVRKSISRLLQNALKIRDLVCSSLLGSCLLLP